jgi:hypothetical protein
MAQSSGEYIEYIAVKVLFHGMGQLNATHLKALGEWVRDKSLKR